MIFYQQRFLLFQNVPSRPVREFVIEALRRIGQPVREGILRDGIAGIGFRRRGRWNGRRGSHRSRFGGSSARRRDRVRGVDPAQSALPFRPLGQPPENGGSPKAKQADDEPGSRSEMHGVIKPQKWRLSTLESSV